MIGMVVFSIISPWIYAERENDIEWASMVHPIHRLLWGTIICLIIYNCSRGRGIAVNWFLSLPIWKPIARLNYAIFLVHVPLIQLTARLLRTEMYFHGFLMVQMGLGTYFLALLIAIPVTLFIEMPFINLESDWKMFKRSHLKQHVQ